MTKMIHRTAAERCRKLSEMVLALAGDGSDMEGFRSRRRLPFPIYRGIVMKRMRDEGYGFSEIGRAMHKNHSTVMYWTRELDNMAKYPSITNASYLRVMDLLEKKLANEDEEEEEDKMVPLSKINEIIRSMCGGKSDKIITAINTAL